MAGSRGCPGVLLASLQVPGLAAGQTDWHSISGLANTDGSGNSVIMTPNGPNSTQPDTGVKWHGLTVVTNPGVLNPYNPTAAWPDLQMWWVIDSNLDTKSFWMADLSQPRVMFPPRRLTAGRHIMRLGKSLFKAAQKRNFGAANWPLLYTGPKVVNDIVFHFSSTAGFSTGTGATDTFITPPTIELWGDAYDAAMWQYVMNAMGAWQGGISITSQRRELLGLGRFTATHQVPAGLANFAGDGFQQLPDGVKQSGGAKVYKMLRWTNNSNAFTGTDVYALTNQIQGLGNSSQVPGTNHDLGFPFVGTQDAVQVDQFGRLPVAGSGYWGITSAGTNNAQKRYPFDSDYGSLDTAGNPHYWWGYSYPVNGENEYEVMKFNGDASPSETGPEVFAYENAAYFTAALSGQTVAAGAEYHGIAGQWITT